MRRDGTSFRLLLEEAAEIRGKQDRLLQEDMTHGDLQGSVHAAQHIPAAPDPTVFFRVESRPIQIDVALLPPEF